RFMKAHGIPLDELEGDQIRVLIVETDRDLTSLLRDTFKGDPQFRIETAASAFEAGAMTQEFQPHVLVLDVDIPGIDGADVMRFLAGRVELQSTHRIATGASLGPADRSALLQEGFQAVLPKPYHIRELTQLIDRLMHA